jgi:predicted acyl esterase
MFRTSDVALLLAFALLTGACSSDDSGANGASPDSGTGLEADGGGGDATFAVGGSIEQVWITDATEGDALTLLDADGAEVQTGTADRLGSLILRHVTPGDGYTVRGPDGATSGAFRVLSRDDTPDPSLYEQELVEGLNYVEMRDGIELAMTVRLPSGMTLDDGPFPTLIEYSGYQVAAPHDLLSAAADAIASGGGLGGIADPLVPDTSTAVGALIAPLLGYAAVSVQMRGSGCSGGDFQLFDLPTTFDGYDAVEVVAAQPWVKGGKVAMGGISFSGISQLFVGGSRPPHLAAVTPLSVTDDIYAGTGFPGGIYNDGFAKSWLNERQTQATPAPEDGAQRYAIALVEQGDTHCTDNQKLRVQTQDINQLIKDNPFRTPSLLDDRTPANWVGDIDVPVFLVGQFQDEQTGGHFPEMLYRMSDNPDVWITMQNGAHVDSLGPGTLTRWAEFLDLFVAERIPTVDPAVAALSTTLYDAIAAGAPSMPLPATRFDAFTDVAAARSEFRKDPRVRLLFDSGGGDLGPGALQTVWELPFDSWPPTSTATTFHLADAGLLTPTAPAAASEVSYVGDPSLRPATTLGGGGQSDPWAALPDYDWAPVADGAGLGFSTDPLSADVVIAGASSLDLELMSSAADTDLQVTISDVRPDGQEMYVQAGWLRASHRALDEALSTATDPVQTHLEKDGADMPAGTFTTVRVEIHPVAYAFRAGHRIRVTIQAPGGERPSWTFDTIEDGTIQNTIQLGSSKLVLPVVAGSAQAPMPPCPSNRAQPCRAFTPAANGG